jgi:aminoglycoside phosphotransferase (APT) family kinase protein
MSSPTRVTRSRYYDALLANLDREVQPELTSERARFLYAATRRILARLSVANEHTAPLPENLAANHPDALVQPGVPLGQDALYAALRSEGEILDSIEAAVAQRLTATAATPGTGAAQTTISTELLQTYLQKNLDPKIRVNKFRILAGGRSKQTIMMTIVNENGEEVERVIRRDLVVAITGATVVDEYRVLVALADRGYPVPRPLLLEADTNQLGSAFMVMEKVNGALAGDVFDPPAGKAAVLHSAKVLGKLHAIPAADIAPTIREKSRIALNVQQLRDHLLDLERTWQANARAGCVTMDAVFKWLLENVESVQPLTTVVHGDYSYHNLLFEGDSLTAVMDWELVRIGHPAEDVGYIRAAAIQRVEWSDFMAAYKEGGGPELSPLDVIFYTLVGKLRLMVLLFFARQYFESGATQDLQLADVSIYHLPRLIQQASAEIRSALGIVA